MDEYAPEEESALRLRAVGRVQEGVRATVRTSVTACGRTDGLVWVVVLICVCGCVYACHVPWGLGLELSVF